MSKSGKGLRFASIEDMPLAMQQRVADALKGKTISLMPRQCGKTTAMKALHKTTAVGKTEVLVGGGFMPGKVTRANKYGAVPTTVDGIRFDSKREAAYYQQLKYRVSAGEVRYFLRQVPLHLPGGTRLVVDFLEVWTDGSLHYVDVKGRETATFKVKRREIQHHYPIHVELA